MNPKIFEIEGWMAPEELTWLYETAQKVPQGGLIVEIGAWQGRSSAAIYEGAANNKVVVSIDTWKGQDDLPDHQIARQIDMCVKYKLNMRQLGLMVCPLYSTMPLSSPPPEAGLWSVEALRRPTDKHIQNEFELENKVYFFISDSVEAANHFKDQSIDWLFIDGDHRKCGADIDAYLPKMKPDGLLTGHDYFCFYETIQQEIHKRFYIHELHYSIWARYVGSQKPGWY